jgi:hypothetical protein
MRAWLLCEDSSVEWSIECFNELFDNRRDGDKQYSVSIHFIFHEPGSLRQHIMRPAVPDGYQVC